MFQTSKQCLCFLYPYRQQIHGISQSFQDLGTKDWTLRIELELFQNLSIWEMMGVDCGYFMGIEWIEWESYDMGIQSDGDKKQKNDLGMTNQGEKNGFRWLFIMLCSSFRTCNFRGVAYFRTNHVVPSRCRKTMPVDMCPAQWQPKTRSGRYWM